MDFEKIEHSKNAHSVRFTSSKRTTVIKLALLSDLHWDNPDCDRELLKKHLDFCLKENIPVLLNGDVFCLMQGKGDPRGNKDKIRPEHNTNKYIDSVVETAVEWFKPYAEILCVVGYGNHETAVIKHRETDVIDRFVFMLNHIAKPTKPVMRGGYGGS